MAELIQFDDISGARIGRVVREVENPVRRVRPLAFAPLLESGGGSGLKLGTISTTWSKGANATVTQIKSDGSPLSPTVTFTAANWFATVTVSSGTKKVACARVGSNWILIAAECS